MIRSPHHTEPHQLAAGFCPIMHPSDGAGYPAGITGPVPSQPLGVAPLDSSEFHHDSGSPQRPRQPQC
eukprot:1859980-Rhodomonas_salina.1